MANGTIQPHLVHAESPASGNADGQVSAGFIDKPERSVPPWQFVGTDGGQDPEDPIWGENPTYGAQEWAARFAADRAILEMFGNVRIRHWAIGSDGPDHIADD
jgi:hypothetical protein